MVMIYASTILAVLVGVATSIPHVAGEACTRIPNCLRNDHTSRFISENKRFDYVIAGAGAGGMAAAEVLMRAGSSVLVIEAGQNGLTNEALALYNVPLMQALVGGSTQINGMVLNRCDKKDVDETWAMTADLTGSSITSENFFKEYFDIFAQANQSLVEQYPDFYKSTGTLEENNPTATGNGNLFELFKTAAGQNGIPFEPVDTVGDTANKLFPIPIIHSKEGGRRQTAFEFVRDFANSTDLFDYTLGSYIDYIEFNGAFSSSPTASAVIFWKEVEGAWRKFKAKPSKGVILTGGWMGSPTILMRSGVGDAADLKKVGIPVIKNLPKVGKVVAQTGTTAVMYRLPENLPWSFVDTLFRASGGSGAPLLLTDLPQWPENKGVWSGSPYVASFNVKTPTAEANGFPSPDANVALVTSDPATLAIGQIITFAPGLLEFLSEASVGPFSNVVTLSSNLHFPSSEGHIYLTNKDVIDPVNGQFHNPGYDSNRLATEDDRQRIAEVMRFTMSFAATPAFRDAGIELVDLSGYKKCADDPQSGLFNPSDTGSEVLVVSDMEIEYKGRKYVFFKPQEGLVPGKYTVRDVLMGTDDNVESMGSAAEMRSGALVGGAVGLEGKKFFYVDNPPSDTFLQCAAEDFVFQLYHETASNRMGNNKDESVIDSSCKVHGIEKLWVADASGFANGVSGNTAAPVFALARLCAKGIIQDTS